MPGAQIVFSRHFPAFGLAHRVPAAQVPLVLPPLRHRPDVEAPAHGSQMSFMQENSCQLSHVDMASLLEMEPEPTQTWVASVVGGRRWRVR